MNSSAEDDSGLPPQGDYDVIVFNFTGIDLVGIYVLASCVGVTLAYFLFCAFDKWKKGWGKMDTVAAGMLRLAAARGDLAALELLAQAPNFSPNAAVGGFTALHAASVEGQADAVAWLCAKGADVNALKEDGWQDSCLHYAASRGHLQCVRVLLAYKADPGAKNFAGATPADLATRQKHAIVARYLKDVIAGKRAPPPPETFEEALADRVKARQAAQGKANGNMVNGSVETNGSLKSQQRALKELASRGFEGYGTPGTEPKFTVPLFRWLCVITQTANAAYLIWRALRTLHPGWAYFYSIPFWIFEWSTFVLSNCFMMSMWCQIERPERVLSSMLHPKEFPHVDVFIVTYTEPVEVIEPTAIAALNMNWPGDKLTVNILDDGRRESVQKMVKKLAFQLQYMRREANIVYVGREKRKGVPHHAKAGNINSAILKEGPGKGVFIMVLDCDMIVHPEFLMRTVGHFYRQEGGSAAADSGGAAGAGQLQQQQQPGGKWVLKEKAALLQTPQDFWNVDANDPMVHCARFFYGPMLQGRDGIGACPCCGTGVLFRRDILVSNGGQAYGSITEDYNTAMCLQSSGFATMYLNTRLAYGMAPDEIEAVFTQRLRWAMGALQILMRTNPLRLEGLNWVQSFLFFEAAAHHWLAISTIAFAMAPILYIFTQLSPIVCPNLWEFAVVFGAWYLSNRLAIWWVHRGFPGGMQELWRGSQMWVWMAPNHIKAILKVLFSESGLFKCFRRKEIGFKVTSKEKVEETSWVALKRGLAVTWPHLLYYLLFFVALTYFLVYACLGYYSTWQITIFISALAWGVLNLLCLWPPIGTLMPRVETDLGWKVVWDAFIDVNAFARRRRERQEAAKSMRLSVQLSAQAPSPSGKQFEAAKAMPLAATAPAPSATATKLHEDASWKGSVSSSGSTAREESSARRGAALGRPALEAVPEAEPQLAGEPSPGRLNSGAAAGAEAPGGALRAVSLGRAPSATTLTRTGSSYRSVFIQSMDAGTTMTPFVRAASTGPGQVDAAAGGATGAASAAVPGTALPVVSPFIAMARVGSSAAEAAAPAPPGSSAIASPFAAMQQAGAAGAAGAPPKATPAIVSPFVAMKQAVSTAGAPATGGGPAAVASPFAAMKQQAKSAAGAAATADGPAAMSSPFAAMKAPFAAMKQQAEVLPGRSDSSAAMTSPFAAMQRQQTETAAASASAAGPAAMASPFAAMKQQAEVMAGRSDSSAAMTSPFAAMQRQQTETAAASASAAGTAAMASPFAAMKQQAAADSLGAAPSASPALAAKPAVSPFQAMQQQAVAAAAAPAKQPGGQQPAAAPSDDKPAFVSPFQAMQQAASAPRAPSTQGETPQAAPSAAAEMVSPFLAMQRASLAASGSAPSSTPAAGASGAQTAGGGPTTSAEQAGGDSSSAPDRQGRSRRRRVGRVASSPFLRMEQEANSPAGSSGTSPKPYRSVSLGRVVSSPFHQMEQAGEVTGPPPTPLSPPAAATPRSSLPRETMWARAMEQAGSKPSSRGTSPMPSTRAAVSPRLAGTGSPQQATSAAGGSPEQAGSGSPQQATSAAGGSPEQAGSGSPQQATSAAGGSPGQAAAPPAEPAAAAVPWAERAASRRLAREQHSQSFRFMRQDSREKLKQQQQKPQPSPSPSSPRLLLTPRQWMRAVAGEDVPASPAQSPRPPSGAPTRVVVPQQGAGSSTPESTFVALPIAAPAPAHKSVAFAEHLTTTAPNSGAPAHTAITMPSTGPANMSTFNSLSTIMEHTSGDSLQRSIVAEVLGLQQQQQQRSSVLPPSGPSSRLPGQKSTAGLPPSGPSGRLPGLLSTLSLRGASLTGSLFNTTEMRQEARSNIGRVAMPEQTARALAASTLLTSVILPERTEGPSLATLSGSISNGGRTIGSAAAPSLEQPLYIALDGGKVAPADAAIATGASVNLAQVFSTGVVGASLLLGGSQGDGGGSTLTREQESVLNDFATLTGTMPSAMLGSYMAGGSLVLGGPTGLPHAGPSLGLGHGGPSLALPAIAEDNNSQMLGGARRAGRPARPPRPAPSTNLGPGGLGAGGLGGSRLLASAAMPSLALHSRAQHSMQLQTRPPANATPDERVAWASQQLQTLASMFSPMSGAMLSGGNQSLMGGLPSLAGGLSTMVVPVAPATIFEHTLAARPNFANQTAPGSSLMFLAVNAIMLFALMGGSILEVEVGN